MTIKRNAMGAGVPAGAASATIGSLNNNITALGSTQATATLLSLASNSVVTVGAGSTGVILPPGNGAGDALSAGDWVRVYNAVAGNAINVYPPLGGKINGGTLNAAISLAALKPAEFICIDGLNFFANISA